MPVTPRFTVSQTKDAVIVCIKVPHVRVGGAETYVDGRDFSFYCKPYLLRLTLPHDLRDDEEESCKAVYDPNDDNGTITANLPKASPGQHFPDLDLTTTLMQPRWTPGDLVRRGSNGGGELFPCASVEVVSSEQYDVRDDDGLESGGVKGSVSLSESPGGARGDGEDGNEAPGLGGGDGAGGGVLREEERVSEPRETSGALGEPDILVQRPHYGFNNRFSGVFADLRNELREAIQLPDPDGTPPGARRALRREHEEAAFDVDRYLADSFSEEEDPVLTEALTLHPHWCQRLRRQRRDRDTGRLEREGLSGGEGEGKAGKVASTAGEEARSSCEGEEGLASFAEREREQMRRLPNREYLIPAGSLEERRVLLGLADVLFAYAYDHRTTAGEPTVESGWTVAILSPLLSWLESSEGDVDEACVALSGMRRSLIFPYLRVWRLARLAVGDVSNILAAGKRCVLRCLLQTHGILERGDVYYLLNKLFMEDYCVWIQQVSDASLEAFAARYASATSSLEKDEVGLGLQKIEADAVGEAAGLVDEGDSSEETSEESSEEDSEASSEESSGESSEEESEESSEESSGEDSDDESDSSEEDRLEDRRHDGEAESRLTAHAVGCRENNDEGGTPADGPAPAHEAVSDKKSDADTVPGALGGRNLGDPKKSSGNDGADVEKRGGDCPPAPRTASISSELLDLEFDAKGASAGGKSSVTRIADRLSSLRLETPGGPSGDARHDTGKRGVVEASAAREPGGRDPEEDTFVSGGRGPKNLIEEL